MTGLEHTKLFVEVLLRILEQVIVRKVAVAALETAGELVGVVRYEGINAIVRDEGEIPAVSVDEQALVLPPLLIRPCDGIQALTDALKEPLLNALIDAGTNTGGVHVALLVIQDVLFGLLEGEVFSVLEIVKEGGLDAFLGFCHGGSAPFACTKISL